MKEERDFKLVCTGGPYGDCCCSYDVELRGEWTVQEFVKAVLERNPCELGFFYIQRAGQKWYEAQVKIEYQYGNMKSTVPKKIARKKIKRVHSNDGLLDRNIKTRRRTGQRRSVFVKRLVSRVIARRIVAEVEQICGLKMQLESTRQLVEQQNWRKIAYITADCFVVRPLRRWLKRRHEK